MPAIPKNQESGLSKELTEKPRTIQGMVQWLKEPSQFERIQKATLTKMPKDWFARQIGKALQGNDKLKEAAITNPNSLLNSLVDIAYMGLDVGVPNEVHLVPFKGKVTAMPGYKGLQKMAIRRAGECGRNIRIDAQALYENDHYVRRMGLNPAFEHEPAPLGKRGRLLGFYAIAVYEDSTYNFVEMSIEEARAHLDEYSKSTKFGKGPYANGKNEIHYGLKSCIRRLVNSHLHTGLVPVEPGDETEEVEGEVVDAQTGEVIS